MPTYTGTSGTDYITGSSSGDTIYGLGGNDTLDGGAGADLIRGGDGNDTIISGPLFENSYDRLYGENGDDTVTAGAGDLVDGGSGTDRLNGNYQNATAALTVDFSAIWTGGSITVAGGAITNMERLGTIYGSAYNDTFTTGSLAGSSTSLFGWSGNDVLTGGAGRDWLEGFSSSGNGDTEADLLYGLDGDDLLGGGVNDTLDGGSGIDSVRLVFTAATSGVTGDFTAVLGGSAAMIGGITLTSIEHIQTVLGSDYDDVFDVSADAYGGIPWGSTAIEGNGGNDILIGSATANVLNGGTGDDFMSGGAGGDLYSVDSLGDVIVEGAGGGIDSVNSGISYTLGAELEQLMLTGTAALNGTGNALDNSVSGNPGANFLEGLAGADILDGYDGADILIGGAGRDQLTGGAGADTFRFASGDFAGLTTTTADLIYDFSQAEGDRIDLSAIDAAAGGIDDAFSFLGTGAFTGVAGELRYEYSGTRTMVYGDLDGNGVADFAVALTGNITLVSSDFHL
ncbi:calcium-binding protein [Sphingomonas kyeonggiensis]|uniref:Ca2+-binding RTX toxin-like protein n=1 Tax=Sphingomonas kyeonggiensis TaxID=1268553 RepID=A0A7W6JY71_9SPHN|nr:calcium-binding protein [Sphingomonas kyeonggiensis]MBB4100726.1 Ca2+-binding RTX toxin-like protein [Sphingomonas kyeonggiensis]